MKHIIIAILVLLAAGNAFGQNKITALHYNISIPGGQMSDYISDASWLGIGFDGRWFVSPDRPITLGISLGWQVFDEHTSETLVTDRGALTGKQGRYINSFPMMVTGHYYFGSKDRTWFFLGAGVGTYYVIQRFDVGVFAYETDTWHFGAYPEVGVQIPLQMEGDLFISGRYNMAFKAGESIDGQGKEWDYWQIDVGFAYYGW
jgi:hypothetical protein